MKKIILIILIFAGNMMFSQEWKKITEKDGYPVYYKPNTFNTAWLKVLNKEGHQIILFRFNCVERQIGILQLTQYTNDNKQAYSTKTEEYEVEMEYVIPDTAGELLLNTFCNE